MPSRKRGGSIPAVDLRQLRHFVVAAELLDFGRAASDLGISATTLRRHIRGLEKTVAMALFDRGTNGLRLTTAGARLLREGRRILDEVGKAVRDVRGRRRPGLK